ncbi:MAG: TetR family transcriptional regulator [Planctomycetes bacterium]|nr:TetR family transcriptional regulator [Planctomycetota bacterium]
MPVSQRVKKAEKKREAILRSAARAFARRGYHGTSMEDIAGELLMTKGSLYYYFKDKEDILFACHEHSLDKALANLAMVEAMKTSADHKLAALIRAQVEVIVDTLQGSAMALDYNALSAPLLDKIVTRRDAFEQGLRRLVREGVKSGAFAKVDDRLASFMIFGAINWVAKWYRQGGEYDVDRIAGFFAGVFLAGLKSGEVIDFSSLALDGGHAA